MAFKPFEQVLVRDFKSGVWRANLFSHYRAENDIRYGCVASSWRFCIPFKGNEQLLGTNKDCSCEYKEFTFLQKVLAWNGGEEGEKVRGYFFERLDIDGIGYNVINPKTKTIDFFRYCVEEEWEGVEE